MSISAVVRGRDLSTRCDQIHVHSAMIGMSFVRAASAGMPDDVLADEMRIARVFRIHGHGGIAGNRFRARGGIVSQVSVG